jgi:hypothetical protein
MQNEGSIYLIYNKINSSARCFIDIVSRMHYNKLLSPWSNVIIMKLIVIQTVSKFPLFYGNYRDEFYRVFWEVTQFSLNVVERRCRGMY